MAKHLFIAFSSGKSGQEAEFERWYDEQHIPDILRVDGFVAAQRYSLETSQSGGTPQWSTMVIYEIESDDVEQSLAQLGKLIRTPAIPVSDSIDMTKAMRLLARPVTKRFEKKK